MDLELLQIQKTRQCHSVVLATDFGNWAQDRRHGNEVTP